MWAMRHGAEALEQLRRSRWDLVLLDLVMPGADGFEFLAGLEGTPHPPILVVTQYDDADSRERVLALGATRCVSKVAAFERGFAGELGRWLAEIAMPQRRGS